MPPYPAIDAEGRNLRLGDWVRVLVVPRSVFNMPPRSQDAFSRATGNTFQILDINEVGYLEIDMWPKLSHDTLWIEPDCVVRTRRQTRLSQAFAKKMRLKTEQAPPGLVLKFEATAKEGVDPQGLWRTLLGSSSGGGCAIYPEERRIVGSIRADKSLFENAVEVLEHCANLIRQSGSIESFRIHEIFDTEA